MREAGPDLLGTVAGGVELDQIPAQTAIPEMLGPLSRLGPPHVPEPLHH
jgi:hypothetical protein